MAEARLGKFGTRLRRTREAQQLDQLALAKRSAVNQSWISKLETGESYTITLPTLIRIADALRVSLDYLAGRRPGVDYDVVDPRAEGNIID